MRASVQRWGNSLAIRIPKALAEDTSLRQGTEVNVTVERGKLVLAPLQRSRFTLAGLLRGVTARNRHREVPTGTVTGRETW